MTKRGEPTISASHMLAKQLQISQEEIKKNEDVLMDFQFAFLTQNLKRIGYLLSPKGTFFGKQSVSYGRGKLYALLHQHPSAEKDFINMTSLGFSNDHLPGELVLEFRYPTITPDNVMSYPDERKLFGLPPLKEFNEEVIRIALRIQKGKITSLRSPQKVIKSLQRFIDQN